jgi:hypothetical protein
MQLNKRQFKKWIAALDSGEYKQTHCSLQDNKGYCCLGVGCKVTIPKKLIVTDVLNQIKGGLPIHQPAAPTWLTEINKDFDKKTGRDLIALNDSYDFTFTEIATLLELVYIHKILN